MSYQIRYQFRTKMPASKMEIIPQQRRDGANQGRAQTLTSDHDAKNLALCTGTESNLGNSVLGEVGKNSFIALSGKGGYSGLLPLRNCASQPWV